MTASENMCLLVNIHVKIEANSITVIVLHRLITYSGHQLSFENEIWKMLSHELMVL